MNRTPLKVVCVFAPSGDKLTQLVRESFLLYLRRVLAGYTSRTL